MSALRRVIRTILVVVLVLLVCGLALLPFAAWGALKGAVAEAVKVLRYCAWIIDYRIQGP